MIDWIIRNKAWLFSGIGVFLLSGLVEIILHSASVPASVQKEKLDIPAEVKSDQDKSNGGGGKSAKVSADDYAKLFDGYLYYFANSLKPDSVEHVIDDSIVKEIVGGTIFVRNLNGLYLSVSPWSYAPLFREQLKFFEFRNAVPPPVDRKSWESYNDKENPIDQRYYPIGEQIRANLRSYFSDPRRLESFYRAKKPLIKEAVREKVPLALRSKFTGKMNQVIGSFRLVLSPSYRRVFEDYLEVERRYTIGRYGDVSEDNLVMYFQGIYNQHNGPVRLIYPTLTEKDRIQEKPVDYGLEEKLATARKTLFEKSPNAKVAAFAYRRYLEGGDKLVEEYIAILEDLKNSVFA